MVRTLGFIIRKRPICLSATANEVLQFRAAESVVTPDPARPQSVPPYQIVETTARVRDVPAIGQAQKRARLSVGEQRRNGRGGVHLAARPAFNHARSRDTERAPPGQPQPPQPLFNFHRVPDGCGTGTPPIGAAYQ